MRLKRGLEKHNLHCQGLCSALPVHVAHDHQLGLCTAEAYRTSAMLRQSQRYFAIKMQTFVATFHHIN